eukprot:1322871-Alexandrium_andersonii.AAC.1
MAPAGMDGPQVARAHRELVRPVRLCLVPQATQVLLPPRPRQLRLALGASALTEGMPFGDLGAEAPTSLGNWGAGPPIAEHLWGPRCRGPQMAGPP